MSKKPINKPKKGHLARGLRNEMIQYILNVMEQDYFSVEEILELVERRFGRAISRATFYRIINKATHG